MIALILVGAVLVGVLCVLAFTLATYALPLMLGLNQALVDRSPRESHLVGLGGVAIAALAGDVFQ